MDFSILEKCSLVTGEKSVLSDKKAKEIFIF